MPPHFYSVGLHVNDWGWNTTHYTLGGCDKTLTNHNFFMYSRFRHQWEVYNITFRRKSDIFQTQAFESAFGASKEMMKKEESKTTFNIPTTGLVTTIISSCQSFIAVLQKFAQFRQEKQANFPQLRAIPIMQDDVDKFVCDLEEIRKLQYAWMIARL